MLRLLITRVFQQTCAPAVLKNAPKVSSTLIRNNPQNNFSTLSAPCPTRSPLLSNPDVQNISNNITRGVTKFSMRKGKRKAVKAVLTKFYRLNWGMWIHTKCGRSKKLWKKHAARKRRLRQHVFSNASQSNLLDKMVTSYWRRPKYYVDDIYQPYHTREEYEYTYKKPRPYVPLE